MNRTRTAALTAVLLLALAACSSDSGGSSDAEAAVEQAVRDHMQAINDSDVDRILELTSDRCRDQTAAEADAMVALIEEMYGDVELENITVHDLTEDSARVEGESGIEALDEGDGSPWILEDGTWRQDDC